MVAKLQSSPQVVQLNTSRLSRNSEIKSDSTTIAVNGKKLRQSKVDETLEEEYNEDYVLDSLEEALTIQKERRGNDHPDVSRMLHSLALEYKVRNRYDEASRCLNEAIKLASNRTIEKTWLLTCLGNMYKARSMYTDAMNTYLKSVACLTEAGASSESPQLAMLVRMVKRLEVQIRHDTETKNYSSNA